MLCYHLDPCSDVINDELYRIALNKIRVCSLIMETGHRDGYMAYKMQVSDIFCSVWHGEKGEIILLL